MRKKPDRKLLVAAMVLCVAMAAASAGAGKRARDDAPAFASLAPVNYAVAR